MRPFLLRSWICFLSAAAACPVIAQNEGDSIFSAPLIHEVRMTFSQPFYWDSLTAYYVTDQYLKGDITFDGTAYPNTGIKFKGNSSYSNPSDKKSFKVDMNEYVSGQEVNGLKKFNLNNCFKDPSFLREKLTLDFCNEHGIAAPRCTYSRVYINGTYWGLYTLVEEADNGTFLKQRFDNKQGNMFKGDPSGDLKWLGSSPASYYSKYELKTNETANDWSDLVNLLDNISNSGSFFYDSLETAFNTASFIRNWAVDNMFANLDSYIGSGHNYFIYHDTLSNKFEWVTWDVNEAFGNFKMGLTVSQLQDLSLFHVSSPATNRPLVQKMLQNTTYKNSLAATVCEWLQHDFSNAGLDAKIDSLVNAIRTDVYADTKKTYSNTHFEDNITMDLAVPGPMGGTDYIMGIKPFITARRSALAAELSAFGCTVGITEPAETAFRVYPVPASDAITVEAAGTELIRSLSLSDLLGREVRLPANGNTSETIDISAFAQGAYLLKVNGVPVKKILVLR